MLNRTEFEQLISNRNVVIFFSGLSLIREIYANSKIDMSLQQTLLSMGYTDSEVNDILQDGNTALNRIANS